ncbi:Dolichyldiphosphatase 1, partial [Mortierella sp. AD010]
MEDPYKKTKNPPPPPPILTSLSLTHVQFSGDDIYSKIFAHLTLSPLAITCGYVAVLLTTRDLTVILMLAGQFLNECINFILKHR